MAFYCSGTAKAILQMDLLGLPVFVPIVFAPDIPIQDEGD
jgi:hypothetical protein